MRFHLAAARALAALPILAMAIPVLAQPQPANVEALRQVKESATVTFLNRSQPVAARLAAIEKMGYPDAKTFAALLNIGKDQKESSAIRTVALRRHKFDEAYFDAMTKILEDPADGDENLDTNLVLDLGQRIT